MSGTLFIKGSSLDICEIDVIFSVIKILYNKVTELHSGVINKILWVAKD